LHSTLLIPAIDFNVVLLRQLFGQAIKLAKLFDPLAEVIPVIDLRTFTIATLVRTYGMLILKITYCGAGNSIDDALFNQVGG